MRQEPDRSQGINRTEIVCNARDAPLGHVFDRGPPTTRLRDCIDSAALTFGPRPPAHPQEPA
ncbi:MAG: peptide-methionine (R)-S-oxide reductase [Burkholderiaceae bacterium]